MNPATSDNSLLRDLVWVIRSPVLWFAVEQNRSELSGENLLAAWTQSGEQLLENITGHESRLQSITERAGPLLGKRFEALVSFWLEGIPDVEILSASLPVYKALQTTGEYDFLLRDTASGEVIHLEVSCKYYLAAAPSSNPEKWMGVNPTDTLAGKQRIMRVQCGLSDTPEGADALLRAGIDRPTLKLVLMKGFLFVPHQQLGRHPLPRGVSRTIASGWWMREGQVSDIPEYPNQWVILPVDHRLGAWRSSSQSSVICGGTTLASELKPLLARYPGVVVVQATKEEAEGNWVEQSRGMVVRDQWPSL